LIQWIRSWVRARTFFFLKKPIVLTLLQHGSCPTCRNIFLSNVYPDSESDDESDDEEYVPNEHDDSDDEEYPNEHDEFEDGEEEEDEDEEEDEEEESFPFESETGDVEDLNAFEEEDNHAIGSGIMDAVFEDFINEELLMEAAASREADAVELAQVAEEVAARMEAELEEVAEPFSFGDLAEEEEEEHRRLEADFFLEAETEECTDLSDWDDSEDLRFSVADSFQPENEGKYLKS